MSQDSSAAGMTAHQGCCFLRNWEQNTRRYIEGVGALNEQILATLSWPLDLKYALGINTQNRVIDRTNCRVQCLSILPTPKRHSEDCRTRFQKCDISNIEQFLTACFWNPSCTYDALHRCSSLPCLEGTSLQLQQCCWHPPSLLSQKSYCRCTCVDSFDTKYVTGIFYYLSCILFYQSTTSRDNNY